MEDKLETLKDIIRWKSNVDPKYFQYCDGSGDAVIVGDLKEEAIKHFNDNTNPEVRAFIRNFFNLENCEEEGCFNLATDTVEVNELTFKICHEHKTERETKGW